MSKTSARFLIHIFIAVLLFTTVISGFAQSSQGKWAHPGLIQDRHRQQSSRAVASERNTPSADTIEEPAAPQIEHAGREARRRWEAVPGPETGTIINLLVKGGRVYAGGAGGVFVSENRGRSWRRIGLELWRRVFTLFDAGDSILAGTDAFGGGNFGSQPGGLWRSTNGGVTWQPYGQGLPENNGVNSITKVGNTLFASVFATDTFMPTAYRSTDNGATWQLANKGLPDSFWMLLTGSQTSIMAWTPDGIYRSDATGAQWNKVELGLPANASITYGIFPAAFDDNFFIATSVGVYISNNAGQSWYASNYGLPTGAGVRDVGFFGNTPYVILDNGDLYDSSSLGAEWKLRNAGFAVGRSNTGIIQIGNTLLSGSFGNGILRSTDQGAHWNAASMGLLATEVTGEMVVMGNRLYVPTSGGVWMSRNKGETWTLQNKGFPQFPYSDLSATTMGRQGRRLYVGLNFGGLYSSDNLGNTWEPVGGGLPEGGYASLIKAIGSKLYVSFHNYGVWVSEDRGKSWKQIPSLPSDVPYFAITRYRNTLLVGSYGLGVFRSDDDGQTWRSFNNGLRDVSLAIDDFDVYNNIVTVGTDDSLYRMKADGSGWEERTDYAETIKGGMNFFGRVGRTLYASTWGRGVAVSHDNGLTWAKLSDGLNTQRIYAFAVMDDDLFVGTLGDGLFLLRNAGNSRYNAFEE